MFSFASQLQPLTRWRDWSQSSCRVFYSRLLIVHVALIRSTENLNHLLPIFRILGSLVFLGMTVASAVDKQRIANAISLSPFSRSINPLTKLASVSVTVFFM